MNGRSVLVVRKGDPRTVVSSCEKRGELATADDDDGPCWGMHDEDAARRCLALGVLMLFPLPAASVALRRVAGRRVGGGGVVGHDELLFVVSDSDERVFVVAILDELFSGSLGHL